MKYRICQNGNGKYKIQYKSGWFLWFDLEKLSYKSRRNKWQVLMFDTIEEAEKRIVLQKKSDALKRERHENKNRSKTWSCMGEY